VSVNITIFSKFLNSHHSCPEKRRTGEERRSRKGAKRKGREGPERPRRKRQTA